MTLSLPFTEIVSAVLFSRYGELFVEDRKLFLPIMYLAPPLGVTPLKFHYDLWRQKTSVTGLRCGVVYTLYDDILSRFVRTPGCDRWADRPRQTDGRTECHSIYRASIASRSKSSSVRTTGNGRFPDNHFPGQDVSRKDVSRTTACPNSSIISRTRRFPDNHFPGQTFPGQFVYIG